MTVAATQHRIAALDDEAHRLIVEYLNERDDTRRGELLREMRQVRADRFALIRAMRATA